MTDSTADGNFIELTAEIVSAYVSNNTVAAGDIPSLKPAVSLKKSVTPEYIVCLEDGKKFKSLKRHLRTQYNMTPEQYREKWGLVADYPMVAPNYAAARSQLAKQMGLGQQRRRRAK
jgi:predicted transcriptional regulator